MIKANKVVALIPARGGSKGIPGKNLLELGGISLTERAVQLASTEARIDQTLVSTDCPDIYSLSERLGCATPEPRPKHLADDKSRTVDIIHYMVDIGLLSRDDIVLLLQPTTPLRTTQQLNAVCDLLEDNFEDLDGVVSINRIDGPHPYKAQVLKDGFIQSLLATDSTMPRQSLPTTYLPNGAFYLIKVAAILEESTFIPKLSRGFEMDSLASINLDTQLDLLLLQCVLDKGLASLPEYQAFAPKNTTTKGG